LNLPESIAEACARLFAELPLDRAMPRLTGTSPIHTELVEEALKSPVMAGRDDLAAGLWLYVDDLDRSHTVSQALSDATGAFWHGIMHRREGDFSNSHYWMRRAAAHPLIAEARQDPDALVDAVSRAGAGDHDLVERQRSEWRALFEWCANDRNKN
jgi:hypothetical protein